MYEGYKVIRSRLFYLKVLQINNKKINMLKPNK